MLVTIRQQCPLCLERAGYHYRFVHEAMQELRRVGLSLPPRGLVGAPALEHDALRREQEAIIAEAQALLRQR